MESEDSGGEWRRCGRKRCRPKNSDSSSDVPQQPKRQDNTSLTVIFVPVKEETRLSALNSLKVSEALEKLCQECIIQIANVRRLGRSRVVKVAFTSTKLPSYVLLGHTDRYNVTIVTDLATRKSPANVRRPAAVVGNTMTGRVLNGWGRTGGGGGATFWPAVMWVPRWNKNSRAVGNGGRLERFLAVGSGSAPGGVAGSELKGHHQVALTSGSCGGAVDGTAHAQTRPANSVCVQAHTNVTPARSTILGSIPTPARFDLDERRTGVRSCITTAWCTLKTPG
ncbi:hypothetical protein HPB47_016453 [Ixodes persulcatus]|uniref:Uncharacterized protein n=1 Tax=Ixodes persulcatus TaxID=34615 RepID=A0AC60QQV4_IXOPE|nr:hypothetical protein HPB47_016453 [Ixodes persulcatus]